MSTASTDPPAIRLIFWPWLPIFSLPAFAGGRLQMALMMWNNSYSVGVPAVDSQHNVLFDIINELHAAMMNGQAQSLTGPLLRKLLDYTNTHFKAEEAMMASAQYPALESHKVKHRELVKQVEDFINRFERGEVSINLHLLNFLRDWLTNHIQKVDMEYSACLIQHAAH
jgi:hemerythrin